MYNRGRGLKQNDIAIQCHTYFEYAVQTVIIIKFNHSCELLQWDVDDIVCTMAPLFYDGSSPALDGRVYRVLPTGTCSLQEPGLQANVVQQCHSSGVHKRLSSWSGKHLLENTPTHM